jgi:hypothetical protein
MKTMPFIWIHYLKICTFDQIILFYFMYIAFYIHFFLIWNLVLSNYYLLFVNEKCFYFYAWMNCFKNFQSGVMSLSFMRLQNNECMFFFFLIKNFGQKIICGGVNSDIVNYNKRKFLFISKFNSYLMFSD